MKWHCKKSEQENIFPHFMEAIRHLFKLEIDKIYTYKYLLG